MEFKLAVKAEVFPLPAPLPDPDDNNGADDDDEKGNLYSPLLAEEEVALFELNTSELSVGFGLAAPAPATTDLEALFPIVSSWKSLLVSSLVSSCPPDDENIVDPIDVFGL